MVAGLEVIFDNCYRLYQISAAFQLPISDGRRPPEVATGPTREGERPVLNTTIMLFLLQDGITNGAIYALLGLALVLVFAVTRVILIPQGEFVTYGALSYAMLATGKVPGTARLAVAMGVVAFGLDLFAGAPRAAPAAGRRARRAQHRPAGRDPGADLCARRPQNPDRGQYRAVAADRRGDRAVSLPHRVSAAGAHLGAGAADRLGRLPSRAAGPRPGVLRRRRPARTGAVGRGVHRRAAALHRPEHRGLRRHHRLHRRRCGCSSASR